MNQYNIIDLKFDLRRECPTEETFSNGKKNCPHHLCPFTHSHGHYVYEREVHLCENFQWCRQETCEKFHISCGFPNKDNNTCYLSVCDPAVTRMQFITVDFRSIPARRVAD